MSITSTVGPFSGLNTGDIITKLMEIERQPIDRLTTKKEGYEKKISAFGELKSAISDLKNAVSSLKAKDFKGFTATSSDETVLTAKASSEASVGEYSITVQQLAKQQKLYSTAFASDTTTFNNGVININEGEKTTAVTINYKNNTLKGIKDAINSSGANVSASIVTDSSGAKLLISSKSAGADSNVTINGVNSSSGFQSLTNFTYLPDLESNMTLTQRGQDALVKIDGLSVTSKTNTLTNVISGLTLDLKSVSAVNQQTGEAVPTTITVGADTTEADKKINDFVTAYNTAMSKAKDITNKDLQGALVGDTTVKSIMNELRSVTVSTYNNATLAQYGITHDRYGALQVDTARTSKAMEDDAVNFINTLDAMATGFGKTLGSMMTNLIPAREDTYKSNIRSVEDQVFKLESNMEKKQAAYTKKFSALEKTIADLQTQSTNMTNAMANLNK